MKWRLRVNKLNHLKFEPRQYFERRAEIYRNKVHLAASRAPTEFWSRLKRLTTAEKVPAHLPFSNIIVRRHAAKVLARLLRVRQHSVPYKAVFATYAWSEGLFPIDDVAAALPAMTHKVAKSLRSIGFQGILVFEVDIVARDAFARGVKVDRISIHCHAIGWVMKENFKPKKAGKAESARRAFPT